MKFQDRSLVVRMVTDAIEGLQVLRLEYCHLSDGETVEHRIAPFDIGSTNPRTAEKSRGALWACAFTHVNAKTGLADPKVVRFEVTRVLDIEPTGDTFNASELAIAHLRATGYDYRTCAFALLPNRMWFRKQPPT